MVERSAALDRREGRIHGWKNVGTCMEHSGAFLFIFCLNYGEGAGEVLVVGVEYMHGFLESGNMAWETDRGKEFGAE